MPDKPEGDKSKKANVTRLQKMRDDAKDKDLNPEMPPCEFPHLIDYLYEVGPVIAGSMGSSPLSYLEIQAWQDLTGIDLHPWEVRIIRRLSISYLNESHDATKINRSAPWQPVDVSAEQRMQVAQTMMDAFRRMAADD